MAKLLLAKPEDARILWNEEDAEIIHAFSIMFDPIPQKKRGRKPLKKT